MTMESNLVAEFVSKTGATSLEAHNHLKAKGWDLKQAIYDYLNDGKENATRPALKKSDAFDDSSCKKLSRGISRATDNACVVSRARLELGLNFQENGQHHVDQYFMEAPVFSFTLPDFSIFSDDFREFLERDLIELSCLTSLEQAGRLNWWIEHRTCPRLWPLSTTGDGNCLLHAASLGMWGFHDRLLILRKALHDFLTTSACRKAIWRRWRWQLTLLNAEAGLIYTEEEWEKEWEAIISMASSTPRNSGRRRSMIVDKSSVLENATYESLEEIHVFALAHVLKRTIIVIADTMLKDVHGENLAPILFGGIYLPLEIDPRKCHRNPLILSYDAAHFSALVTMDNIEKSPTPSSVIPLTDNEYKLLPVQFLADPGEDFVWGRDELVPGFREKLRCDDKVMTILRDYLDVMTISLSTSPSSEEYEEMETPGDEEDIEKRFCEADHQFDIEDQVDSAVIFAGNRSKAARQLQTVAKSFGSIGKSMSKKLKKNLGTITKITRGSDKRDRAGVGISDLPKSDFIIVAKLGGDCRPEYQEEMVKNYIQTARTRFARENAGKLKIGTNSELERLAKTEGSKQCITPGCPMYASVLTSYLCSTCYDKQRQQELVNINSPLLPRSTASQTYGMGKSTFYVDPSITGNTNQNNGVTLRMKSPEEPPPPLHLNRSTFYSDPWYPLDWNSSAAGRNTISAIPTKEPAPSRRQDIGSAVDGLGSGRYTPTRGIAQSELNPWEHDSASQLKMHSYNLSRDSQLPTKGDGYGIRNQAMRSNLHNMSPQSISTSTTTMSPQSSQDLPEIENVQPILGERFSRKIENDRPVTRIIPITVEGSVRTIASGRGANCLNVTCDFYGSPEMENYCSKCYKGRRETVSRSAH